MSRRYINLPNRPTGLPFSDGVLVGDTLYISGRIGLDPATGEAPESIDAEIEFLFEGFQSVLRHAGHDHGRFGMGADLFAGCFLVAAVQCCLCKAVLAGVSCTCFPGIGNAFT